MVSQPRGSIVNKNNTKSTNETITQEKKVTKVDEMTNNALRVPGSNWEKFKSLLGESKANKESTETTINISPRKRHRTKKFNNRQDLQVCLNFFSLFLLLWTQKIDFNLICILFSDSNAVESGEANIERTTGRGCFNETNCNGL